MRMRQLLAAAIAGGWLCAPLAVRAAESLQESPVATLTVTGQSQISRPPDLATVAVSVVTNDDNAARALSQNNRRYATIKTKLAALGIAESELTSTSISSYFNPRPSGPTANAPGQLFGFIVTRSAQINVRALTQTGAVVDAATAAGATQINGVTFGFVDRRAVERAAQAAAVADAYAQAQVVAAAAHVQIVRVLRIGDEATRGPLPAPMALMSRAAEAAVPTTIRPSDVDVTGSVSITYVIR